MKKYLLHIGLLVVVVASLVMSSSTTSLVWARPTTTETIIAWIPLPFGAQPASADTTTDPGAYLDSLRKENSTIPNLGFCKDQATCTLQALLNWIVGLIFTVAGTLAVVLIVYNGFNLAKSEGKSDALGAAEKGVKSAVFGLLAILFSYALIRLIIDTVFQLLR